MGTKLRKQAGYAYIGISGSKKIGGENMGVDFKDSETKVNLMRSFAGESQARNRYTFAAAQAEKKGLHVISAIFAFTAAQEREHARVFYDHLRELAGETVFIDGGYPVNLSENLGELLRAAQQNEYEEYTPVYKSFGEKAMEEGFNSIAASFFQIAEIEKAHGNRFGQYAEWLEQGKLFVSDVETQWMCLNCGFIYKGLSAPLQCPVCKEEQGYYIRFELSPYRF